MGFLVNYPKSVLEPTQKLIFIGFIINSIRKELSLPQEKNGGNSKEAKAISELQQISAHALAQLIGKMSVALLAVQPALLHYRSLQNLKLIALRKKGYNNYPWQLPKIWIHNMTEWNGRAIQTPDPTMVIETDALKKGWGAFY